MFTKKFKSYVLIDPITNIPRYVGVTTRTLGLRFSGHLNDVHNRPNLNKHKTNWFQKLMKGGKMPIIKQIAEFDSEQEMLLFEKDYIRKYKEEYKLINQTEGGETMGFKSHDRETILKRKTTRPVIQYNILGEKVAEYEITEDVRKVLNLGEKACTHITQCCKKTRTNAYGYIWRYKDDPLGDISNLNPKSLSFNKLVQYDLEGNRIAEYSTYAEASIAIGDKSKGGNISAVITGKQHSCKGFIFKLEPIYVYFNLDLFDKIILLDRTIHSGNKKSKIIVLEKDNQTLEFTSFSEAAKFIGNYNWREKIKECCEGKRSEWKGYKFKYKGSL